MNTGIVMARTGAMRALPCAMGSAIAIAPSAIASPDGPGPVGAPAADRTSCRPVVAPSCRPARLA